MVKSNTIEIRLLEDTVNENSDFQNEATFSNYFSLKVFGMMFRFRITILLNALLTGICNVHGRRREKTDALTCKKNHIQILFVFYHSHILRCLGEKSIPIEKNL